MAQVIADQLGVPYEDVTVFEGDSARGGFGPGAAGSRQGVLGGGAATKTARLLADKVKRVAAHLLNANPEDVRIDNGQVQVAGAPEMTRSLREIAEIAYGEPARLPPGMETGLEAQSRYDPPPMTFTSAAHACVVEVDAETGFVKIRRWISSEDCGVMINPAVVEGQVAGGLAQGIGEVLLEEAGYDARGNPIAATYKDYLLPTIFDVPDFEYLHGAATPAANAAGVRGVGEGGAIIGPPTLVNAIADALSPFGEIEVDLPLTPAKVLAFIEGRPPAPRPASRFAAGGAEPSPPAAQTGATGPSEVLSGAAAVLEPAAAPSGPVGIDGMWKISIAAPMGSQEMKGEFKAEGSVLTGTLFSEMGDQAFEGTISGDALKWEMKVTKPVALTLKYDVRVEGDRMTGKVKMGVFGNAKLTGERV
jgi:carbon-monoxide dehydrogenase large subunit